MSKLLISDPHARDFGKCSTLVEPIKRRNLQAVLDEWGSVVDRIILTGDIFDKPDPSHYLVSQYAEILRTLKERIINVVVMPGNHDPIFKSSHALQAFQKGTETHGIGLKLITGDEPYFDHEAKACYQAWTKGELPKAPAPDWDYFGHLQVKDWIKFSNEGYSLDEIKAMGFQRAYLGDFHPHRDGGKVVSIGTFGASDFGDEGLDSGYIIANDNGSFTRHRLEHPIFKTIDFCVSEDFKRWPAYDGGIKGNIVKLCLHGTHDELNQLNVEQAKELFLEQEPLSLTTEKVYTQKDKATSPKVIGNLDELIERHKQTWPEGSQLEFVKLQQQGEQRL